MLFLRHATNFVAHVCRMLARVGLSNQGGEGFVLGGFGRTCANVGRDAGKEGTDAAQRKKRRANWLTLSNPFALTCR